MNDDVLVRVERLSKKFCRDLKRSLWYGVKDVAQDLAGIDGTTEHLRPAEFWALNDVSFELRRGECLGLVGRNGAGKTTLLKLLNGLIKPDNGRIEVHGRVGALIALGAGFNPILSGRENIYVNATVLGLTKQEIEEKIDRIIEFADIGEFIDAPVQSYSSGMAVRLGFAIATALEPDVLLIDEVLAVGDSAFRLRCYNKIRDILPKAAVVFVSHNMWDVSKVSTDVCVLDRGKVNFLGDSNIGIRKYYAINRDAVRGVQSASQYVIHTEEFISAVRVVNFTTRSFEFSTAIDLTVAVDSAQSYGEVRLRVVIFDENEFALAEWDSLLHEQSHQICIGPNTYTINVEDIRLRSGVYNCFFIVSDAKNRGYIVCIQEGLTLEIDNNSVSGAPFKL